MFRIKSIFLLITIGITITEYSLSRSNSTYNFLRAGASARAAALGGNLLTTANDPNSIFYNPSAMASLTQTQISIGYLNHLLDINSGHLSYGNQIEGFGFAGCGILYNHYGIFEMRNQSGDKIGNFSAIDLAVTLAYANLLTKDIYYGSSIKFIYSKISDYDSYGLATDFGITYTVIPNKFQVAASLLNLGTQLNTYFNSQESLPIDLKIGGAVKPEHLPVNINISFNKLLDKQNRFFNRLRAFTVGSEFTVTQNFLLRFGYNNENRRDLKIGQSAGLAGFSVGAGFHYKIYKIDYSYNSMGKIAGLNRITLGIIL